MRSFLFRGAVILSMVMVVAPDVVPTFEPPEAAEAAPRRRANRRRVNRSQAARARNARASAQRRQRSQQLARLNRARANRARMNAYARNNAFRNRANRNRATAYRPSPYQMNANRFGGGFAGMPNQAYTPVVVYKDYQLQLGENVAVSSLTPLGRKATLEDVAVGQTVSVTVIKEQGVSGGVKAQAPGQLTGQVVKVESNSASQEVTLRVAAYQYGGQNGQIILVAAAPGQSVSGITIRSRPQGAAGLFRQ